ncbi:DUF6519 domain-containing protein [Streptomyces sp. ISL-11]|uniref:DUF6519 domain-containing protein n=1 Tax=Streptomyces sp. ISL-11 TaxID=2819174 RepID=UPI001BECC966|nr:DUF6519 domain-containing protein [Streptomyces sp. ISL-11]MBT2382257.1 hypothetical protein [Streptomyces sp. ISL-11]
MQGDFSRVTFDPAQRFSAVLSQQGRVQLDSEMNEQTAILLHYLRSLTTDVLGPAACPVGPGEDGGFKVAFADGTLTVTSGHMYVKGILCESDGAEYWTQPDGYLEQARDKDRELPPGPFMVYLRVWERLVTANEAPAIREVALGLHGPDTTARTRVVWQLDWTALGPEPLIPDANTAPEFLKKRIKERFGSRGQLAARTRRPEGETDPCDLPPDAGYRGPENQLYRVEVHCGGTAGKATFKWSRENASVVLPIRSIAGPTVELDTLGRDDELGLEAGDVVEIVDDASVCRAALDVIPDTCARLYRIAEIDHVARRVVLDADPAEDPHQPNVGTVHERHPLVRRWDHQPPERAEAAEGPPAAPADGALPVEEGKWLPLEDGIHVWFEPSADTGSPSFYRAGDYWLIPTRVVTGDVMWPTDARGEAQRRPPHGIDYHYAPLANVEPSGSGQRDVRDLRMLFDRLGRPRQEP